MQKRSKFEILDNPIDLPADLPFLRGRIFQQSDRPIHYLHRHNQVEMGLCLGGEGIFIVENKVMPFREGNVLFIPRMVPHLAQSSPGTESRWIWFYADFQQLILPHFPDYDLAFLNRLHGENFTNIIGGEHPEILDIVQRLRLAAPRREETVALTVLLCLALKDAFSTAIASGNYPASDEYLRIQPAIQHLNATYREECSLAVSARLCGMSPVHFRRIFREAMGCSPTEYREKLRLTMAKTDLSSRKYSIAEVALRCGYQSLSSFNRQFKKMTGTTPSGYNN